MTKVEELRFDVLEVMFLSASHKLLDSLITAAKEEERERIRNSAVVYDFGGWRGIAAIPKSVLSPAPKEVDRE